MNFKKKFAKMVLLKNQIFPSLIIFFLIFLMFAVSINNFNANEKLITNFCTQEIKSCENINNKSINVDFKINSFMDSNFAKSILEIRGIVLFEFDHTLLNEDEVSKFTFYSAEILNKEKILDILQHNKRYLGYDIQLRFKLSLNFKLFPLDDHNIFIILLNHNFNKNNISYCHKKFEIEADLKEYDWRLHNFKIENGTYNSDLFFIDKIAFPAILYQLEIIRYGFREILLILIPLFLAIFLTILMFAKAEVSINYGDISFGIIALFVAYRYSIDSYMPKTSHFILADFLFLFALILASAAFYCRSFKFVYLEKNLLYVLIFIYLLTLGFCFYLLNIW
jgi:hypothetical protein